MKRLAIGLALSVLLAVPSVAASLCNLPLRLSVPQEEGPSAREPQRILPIGGYTLAITWLAENCRKGRSSGVGALDCRARAGKGGFVLHGLWPDGESRDWPQWCATPAPLPPATLRAHYCATPSVQQTQHEWAKHGTCMPGYDAERYLAVSRSLFAGLHMPNLRALSYGRPTRSSIRRLFADANPGMTPDMINLNVTRQGWLEELWVCLDKRMRWTRCAAAMGKPDEIVKIWRGRS